MADWKIIWKQAEMAKSMTVVEHDFSYFAALLEKYPHDGMIHYNKGLAHETLGEKKEALKEFEIAKSLFPMPKWKNIADTAISRIQGKKIQIITDPNEEVIF